MDQFDLGSLRANDEDDILKETIESKETATIHRRVSMLSPRESDDRIEDLPKPPALESVGEVVEDRLWKVTETPPSDNGKKRVDLPSLTDIERIELPEVEPPAANAMNFFSESLQS